jgi:hypothetical protein
MTVTGTILPSSVNKWVIPTFVPSIPGNILIFFLASCASIGVSDSYESSTLPIERVAPPVVL